MNTCCDTILHGWFKAEALFRIGLRHGVDCRERSGQIEEIDPFRWFATGRQARTGEVYA